MTTEDHIKGINTAIGEIKQEQADHNLADDNRFKAIIETNQSQTALLQTMRNEQTTHFEKQAKMLEWFNDMNVIKDSRLRFLKATGLWTGAIVGISTVFSIVWLGIKFLILQVITK